MLDDIETIKTEVSEIKNNIASISESTAKARDSSKAVRTEVDKARAGSSSNELTKQLSSIKNDLNQGIQKALAGLILERKSFKEVLGQFATGFVQGLIKRSLSIDPFAKITPFASGGVINSPTYFPTTQGTGLAGERGAEAILPLARGADGNLGVRSSGSRSVQINIQTPTPAQFFQSQSQLASMVRRAVAKGSRNS